MIRQSIGLRKNLPGILPVFVMACLLIPTPVNGEKRPFPAIKTEILKKRVDDACLNGAARKTASEQMEADTYMSFGWHMINTHNGNAASQAFLEALSSNPRNTKAYWGLIIASHQAQLPLKTVRACYNRASKLMPGDPNPFIDYGNVLIQHNQMEDAINQFQSALKMDKDNLAAMAGTARVYHMTDRRKKADEIMKRMLELQKKAKTE